MYHPPPGTQGAMHPGYPHHMAGPTMLSGATRRAVAVRRRPPGLREAFSSQVGPSSKRACALALPISSAGSVRSSGSPQGDPEEVLDRIQVQGSLGCPGWEPLEGPEGASQGLLGGPGTLDPGSWDPGSGAPGTLDPGSRDPDPGILARIPGQES